MKKRTNFGPAVASLLLAGCITCPPVVRDGAVQLPCCATGTANIVNIDTGSAPWRVKLPTQTSYQPVIVPWPNSTWAPLPKASWVRPPPGTSNYPPGNHTYALSLAVPACSGGRTLTINGSFAGDNTASVFLDTPTAAGTTAIAAQTTPTHGFQAANVMAVNTSIAPATAGTYVLRVVVHNLLLGSDPSSWSDSGMIFRGSVATNCT